MSIDLLRWVDRIGGFVRILVATDHYPPYIGGAQIQSRALARGLRSRGHEVAVATVWQNETVSVHEDDAITVHELRQLRTLPVVATRRRQHHQPPFPDPVTIFALRRLLRRYQPDVVHSHGWMSFSCAAALLGSDIPLVITARDYGYSCAKRTLMYKGNECSGPGLRKCIVCAGAHYGRPKGWIAALGVLGSRRLLTRKISAVHSISRYVQSIVRRDVLDDQRSDGELHIVHDVIWNPDEGSDQGYEIDTYLSQLPDEPFMLFVGALRRVKGVYELLEAYERAESPPRLVLIGTEEPDSPARYPPGVLVLLDFPHEAVMAAWRRCLFGVLPSLFPEPFGTVVCEAMGCGKPVVATEPGGHTDMVVHGRTGLLVPRGDVDALASAIDRLSADDTLVAQMGEAARRRSTLFRTEVSLPKIERLYQEALERRHLCAST